MVTYITDPINDPSAEEVENHLLDCRGCRDFFLTMLKMRSHAAQAEKRGRNSATRKMDRADLIRFSDFRK